MERDDRVSALFCKDAAAGKSPPRLILYSACVKSLISEKVWENSCTSPRRETLMRNVSPSRTPYMSSLSVQSRVRATERTVAQLRSITKERKM